MACAGHVLNDHIGFSRDVFPHVLGQQTRPLVIKSAGRGADVNGDSFSFVKITLRQRRHGESYRDENKNTIEKPIVVQSNCGA